MAKSKQELSNNDRKILDELMGNARQTSIEISEKTGLSRQTVQKTISKLERDHVIWEYKSVVDLRRIGRKIFIILIRTTSKLTKEKTQEILPVASKAMEEQVGINLIYTGLTHGYFHWVIIFAAEDVVQANKIMRRWKSKYSEFFVDFQILEELLPIRLCGALNPDYKEEINDIL